MNCSHCGVPVNYIEFNLEHPETKEWGTRIGELREDGCVGLPAFDGKKNAPEFDELPLEDGWLMPCSCSLSIQDLFDEGVQLTDGVTGNRILPMPDSTPSPSR